MRKTLRYTVPGTPSDKLGARDNGKSFIITEMSAFQAEDWAARLLFAMANAGADVPEGFKDASAEALAQVGYAALGKLKYVDAKPLLAEMLECVAFVPEAAAVQPIPITSVAGASQIEEARTLVQLRLKVFELHTGFSMPELPQTSG